MGCEGAEGASMVLCPGRVPVAAGGPRPWIRCERLEVDVPLERLNQVSRVSSVVQLWRSPRTSVPKLSIFIQSSISEDPAVLIAESEDILYITSEQYYHFCH